MLPTIPAEISSVVINTTAAGAGGSSHRHILISAYGGEQLPSAAGRAVALLLLGTITKWLLLTDFASVAALFPCPFLLLRSGDGRHLAVTTDRITSATASLRPLLPLPKQTARTAGAVSNITPFAAAAVHVIRVTIVGIIFFLIRFVILLALSSSSSANSSLSPPAAIAVAARPLHVAAIRIAAVPHAVTAPQTSMPLPSSASPAILITTASSFVKSAIVIGFVELKCANFSISILCLQSVSHGGDSTWRGALSVSSSNSHSSSSGFVAPQRVVLLRPCLGLRSTAGGKVSGWVVHNTPANAVPIILIVGPQHVLGRRVSTTAANSVESTKPIVRRKQKGRNRGEEGLIICIVWLGYIGG